MSHIKREKEARLSSSQQARREFMEKAGKLAAYTPPLMLGLLIPGQHAIASGAGYDTPVRRRRRRRRRRP